MNFFDLFIFKYFKNYVILSIVWGVGLGGAQHYGI